MYIGLALELTKIPDKFHIERFVKSTCVNGHKVYNKDFTFCPTCGESLVINTKGKIVDEIRLYQFINGNYDCFESNKNFYVLLKELFTDEEIIKLKPSYMDDEYKFTDIKRKLYESGFEWEIYQVVIPDYYQ